MCFSSSFKYLFFRHTLDRLQAVGGRAKQGEMVADMIEAQQSYRRKGFLFFPSISNFRKQNNNSNNKKSLSYSWCAE